MFNFHSCILWGFNFIETVYELFDNPSYFFLKEEKPSSTFQKNTMVQQGTDFIEVLIKNDVTDGLTTFFYRGKLSALFCFRGRIEIKHLFSWLMQNNLLGVEIFFEIQKPMLTPPYNISPPRRLFCNKHDNACFIT